MKNVFKFFIILITMFIFSSCQSDETKIKNQMILLKDEQESLIRKRDRALAELNSTIAEKEKQQFYINEITRLKDEISAKNNTLYSLNTQIQERKDIQSGKQYKYIITFNLRQSHLTLDIGQHLKDSVNSITFELPVDEEYYNSINVNDNIVNRFRMGSLIFNSSFGNWKIKVKEKRKILMDNTNQKMSNLNTQKPPVQNIEIGIPIIEDPLNIIDEVFKLAM